MVAGLPDLGVLHEPYTSCLRGKQHHEPFPLTTTRRATVPLAVNHTDIYSPQKDTSLGGFR